ncbi:MAG: hypothetical protein LBF37_01835 [Rickettsiales bacterium]|nr:hypothetical protein [Rickettsiales bacterium]
MKKLSFVVLMSVLCIGASSKGQILTQQAKDKHMQDTYSGKLTAAQELCFFNKVMYYCPEIILAEIETKEMPPVEEEKEVVSRGKKAETVVEKTPRSEKESGPVKTDPAVQAALECRMLSLMECGVDVGKQVMPALPQGDLREKAITR